MKPVPEMAPMAKIEKPIAELEQEKKKEEDAAGWAFGCVLLVVLGLIFVVAHFIVKYW